MKNSAYKKLLEFITHKMRMSHVYQPLMLITLLKNKGQASVKKIAQEFLLEDPSQVDYYSHIVKIYPSKVLKKHGFVERDKNNCFLRDFQSLNQNEIDCLIRVCNSKLNDYLKKRGQSIFEHRRKASRYIPGTLRYTILKAAKFRCELCGIPAEQKALEIDHIIPQSKGGNSDIQNLQALCYSCNSMKGNKDDTNFKKEKANLNLLEKNCHFCHPCSDDIKEENKLFYAINNSESNIQSHTLIVPKRHISSYDFGRFEINSYHLLLNLVKNKLTSKDSSIIGFKIEMNENSNDKIRKITKAPINKNVIHKNIFHLNKSSQHFHIHLIPNRKYNIEKKSFNIP